MTPAPHIEGKNKNNSGQNMTPNASKQGNSTVWGAIFLFIVLHFMWGLGFQNDSSVWEFLYLQL